MTNNDLANELGEDIPGGMAEDTLFLGAAGVSPYSEMTQNELINDLDTDTAA